MTPGGGVYLAALSSRIQSSTTRMLYRLHEGSRTDRDIEYQIPREPARVYWSVLSVELLPCVIVARTS